MIEWDAISELWAQVFYFIVAVKENKQSNRIQKTRIPQRLLLKIKIARAKYQSFIVSSQLIRFLACFVNCLVRFQLIENVCANWITWIHFHRKSQLWKSNQQLFVKATHRKSVAFRLWLQGTLTVFSFRFTFFWHKSHIVASSKVSIDYSKNGFRKETFQVNSTDQECWTRFRWQ